jgi:hypothetical protein
VPRVRVREPPRQLRRLGDPDALPDHDARLAGARLAGQYLDRPVHERAAVQREPDAERLRELAGTGAELLVARDPAALSHQLDPVHRLERADQHRRPHALVLGHGVQQ